jgi:ribosomal protein S18 acetylase RimI-like enzyme
VSARPLISLLDASHNRDTFDCGVEPLNRYFKTQVGQDVRKRLSTCFVLTEEGSNVPLAYYTLAATSILLVDLPEDISKKLTRYPFLPATLMGRLAVDQTLFGRGYGELMLIDAIKRSFLSEIASYAFVVDAKDDRASSFYRAYDFLPLETGCNRLFLPMTQIGRLFA